MASYPVVFSLPKPSPSPTPTAQPKGDPVYLTFDDGPHPEWTRQILDVLGHAHVRAVFCEIGYAVNDHPRVTHRVAREGHLLCDHTMTHDESLPSRSTARITWEIRHCKHVIRDAAGGVKPVFFRAPGGNWSTEVKQIARDAGLKPLMWNVDPRDWARPGVDSIVHTVMREVHPGSTIVMHDGGGDRSETVEALKILLRKLPKAGYVFRLPHHP
jgi:peptidoglycan/xylan/chitin deacetylase (PgdA/CDA1 family)